MQRQWLKDREKQIEKNAKQAEKAAKVPAKPEASAAAASGIPSLLTFRPALGFR